MDLPLIVIYMTYFTLFYPIVMSLVWVVGAIFNNVTSKKVQEEDYKNLEEQKFIILIPVFNEEQDISKHLYENLNLDYSNYELWVIDDKSTDNSFKEISKISHNKLKVFQNERNLGKAKTLNNFVNKVTTDYFLVVDSDTIVAKDALKVLNYTIHSDIQEANKRNKENKYVAYTGNITVYSEYKNILLHSQKIEYRSFIDMIKRTQFCLTKTIMTLSGAFSCYKTQAVRNIGGFYSDNATEDINISWRFNEEKKLLKYVPFAKASVSTPLNVYDLIIQRKRWTIGLFQTVFQNIKGVLTFKNIALNIFVFEFILSGLWAFSFFFSSFYYIFNILTKSFENLRLLDFIFGIILVLIFSISLSIIAYFISSNDNEKMKTFLKYYIWFPFIYYLVQPLGYVYGLKGYLFERNHGIWRNSENITSKYLFATVTDILVTFISFRVILEIFEDSYYIFQSIPVINLLYGLLISRLIFSIFYYSYLQVGNKFVNKNYSLFLNISFYLTLFTLCFDFYNIYLYSIRGITLSHLYKFYPSRLLFFLIAIVIIFFIFKKYIRNTKNIYSYKI